MSFTLNKFRRTFLCCAALSLSALIANPAVAADASAGLAFQTLQTGPQEQIETAVWYPSMAAEQPRSFGPNDLKVALEGPAKAGRFPLVVVSHGTGGTHLNHHELAAAMARAGFVVVALIHPGDNYRDRSMAGKTPYFSERPRQVSRMLDALLTHARWSPMIDAGRIGFVGHSAGGFTGLALAGATPSLAHTLSHCAKNYDQDPWFCGVSGSREQAIANGRNAALVAPVPNSGDPRIKAAVLIAPLTAFFEDSALQTIKIPVRVYLPAKDDILVPRFHGDRIAKAVPSAQLVRYPDAGHFMLVSRMNLPASVNGSEVNADPPGFDRSKAIAAASKDLPEWFSRVLGK